MRFRIDSDDTILVSSSSGKMNDFAKFTIVGKPHAKTSLKGYRRNGTTIFYQPCKRDMNEVKKLLDKEFLPYCGSGNKVFEKGVHLHFDITFFWSSRQPLQQARFCQLAKKDAPCFPTYPDLDNLEKIVFDSMSGVIYHDDSQVVEICTRKQYLNDYGCEGYTTVEASVII